MQKYVYLNKVCRVMIAAALAAIETPEQQAKRLQTAKVEMAASSEFDFVIVNDDAQRAADELWKIIAKEYDLD